MPDRYSTAHWAQIVKRVAQASYHFDPRWKCFVCGKRFTHNSCTHTMEENQELAAQVLESERVAIAT